MPAGHETSPVAADPPRGRAAVEQRLIEVSADRLASVGPRGLSIRDVSSAAGVNVAQVYHYFGSKDGLLTAAMRHLALEWYRDMVGHPDQWHHPSPLPMSDHPRYWRALCHAMLDGEDELARLEIREGISFARDVIEAAEGGTGGVIGAEGRVWLAAAFTLSLGWAAFEGFMRELVQLDDQELDRTRTSELIEQLCGELIDRALKDTRAR